MSNENYAGNIIVNLASLPDFLRKPMLKKRLLEFFLLPNWERSQMICNVLDAGPSIPFPSLAKLFRAWLEVICTIPEDKRRQIFSRYFEAVIEDPESLTKFNLDGMLEVYENLRSDERRIISKTIGDVFMSFEPSAMRIILMITPDSAKKHLGL